MPYLPLLLEQNNPRSQFTVWYTSDVNDRTLECELGDLDYICGSIITCSMILNKLQHLVLTHFPVHIYLIVPSEDKCLVKGIFLVNIPHCLDNFLIILILILLRNSTLEWYYTIYSLYKSGKEMGLFLFANLTFL